jgi:glycosyltransferase involved in cell wall biosynthesis
MGRKILVCEFDIFKLVGGGQTVYQNIIKKCPNDTFYYFVTSSELEADHPPNAIAVLFRQFYAFNANIPRAQAHFFHAYRESMDMARSVYETLGEIKFDVVDTPDYRQNGLFLRNALETHGISVGTLALALHGTLTSALTLGWPWTDDPSRFFAELRLREHLQFRVADARYAISQFYADELQRHARFPINMLDPLAVIRDTQLVKSAPEDRAADLLFIGRRERRKGPDLFADLAWWLPPGAFRRLIYIGGEGVNHQGADSTHILDGMTRRRRLRPEFLPPVGQSELQKLIREKSLVLVTSRYDQFNLVALEALLDGCPTVISKHTGIAQFIQQRLPGLSWLLVDITCDRTATNPTREILEDYDRKRSDIIEVLQRAPLRPDLDSLQRIYDPANERDRRAQGTVHDLADRFAMFSVKKKFYLESGNDAAFTPPFHTQSTTARTFGGEMGSVRPPQTLLAATQPIRRATERAAHGIGKLGKASTYVVGHARNLLRSPRATVRNLGKYMIDRGDITLFGLNGTAARQVLRLEYAEEISRNLVEFGERSTAEREGKLRYLNDLISGRWLDRVRFFREMVRLERLRGNDLIAATYSLRLLRWLGEDRFRLLSFVQETLREHGFVREAEAAEAMYGVPERADEICRAYLDDQLRRHRVNPERPLEILDDRRGGKTYRVSIVVSLYNAADKLPTFWRMLQQQNIVRSGEAEVVLVDSGSPSDERTVFQELSAQSPLPAVYARSQNRETIQMAWNRGINLSTGSYLAFLGVDEGVHPDCLQVLADELDRNPSIDWVMADSIVTEVDRAGIYSRDIMSYDRTGYRHDWHYLDCTFLSYVGGLYRRSIHDRFGYYDETFRAAGDTEFKNRILPYIKTKYVPRVLGVFNNYPEERTTQHPRAEIEDLRAWYLHRTPAGVSYAFDNRPAEDVVDLLKDTLAYRKCYCQHLSTDIDLADSLATHLARRPDAAKLPDAAGLQKAQVAIRAISQIFQSFEQLRHSDMVERDQFTFVRNYRKIQSLSKAVARQLRSEKPPAFDVFHDNRYEQHWWAWDTWSH